jgi:hypothetical protein
MKENKPNTINSILLVKKNILKSVVFEKSVYRIHKKSIIDKSLLTRISFIRKLIKVKILNRKRDLSRLLKENSDEYGFVKPSDLRKRDDILDFENSSFTD